MIRNCYRVVSFAVGAALLAVGTARAEKVYTNRTGQSIKIAVITTFGPHGYEDCWHQLGPGESVTIGEGRFNRLDTYWLVVTDTKGKAVEWGANNNVKGSAAIFSPSVAWVRRSAHSGQVFKDNKDVAAAMRGGNWEPYKDLLTRGNPAQFPGRACAALKIDAQATHGRATVEIKPNGAFSFKAE